MSIDADLTTALEGHAGLAALVSTRIYPMQFPHGATMPLVTYQRISAPREQAFDRTVKETMTRYQIDAWGANYDASRAVAAQIVAAAIAKLGSGGFTT